MAKAKAKTIVTSKGKGAAKAAGPGKGAPKPSAKAPAKRAPAKAPAERAPAKRAPAKAPAKAAAPAAPPPAWAWHEVLTNDVAAAKAFYTGLFGWSSQEMPMADGMYTVFSQATQQVAGCMKAPEMPGQPACPPSWLSYLRVDDVDATVARARELGARVDLAGTDIPGVGRFAVMGDPTGATFAVFKPL